MIGIENESHIKSNVGRRIALAALTLMSGGSGAAINAHAQEQALLTRNQIEHTFQTVGLSSDACKADPNSTECIDTWNKCNGNQNKPVEQRVTGCFEGWVDAKTGKQWSADGANGQPAEVLTGFIYSPNADCTGFEIAVGDCENYSASGK